MLFGFGCVDEGGVAPGNAHSYVEAFCEVLVKLMHEPLQRSVSFEKNPAIGVVQLFTMMKLESVCDDEHCPFETLRTTLYEPTAG